MEVTEYGIQKNFAKFAQQYLRRSLFLIMLQAFGWEYLFSKIFLGDCFLRIFS